jgi:predicted dehydrogenase
MMNRRSFLQSTSGAVAGLAISGALAGAKRAAGKNLANDRITVCVAGIGGRGNGLLQTFAGMDEVDLKYVCDIDERILDSRTEALAKSNERVAKRQPEKIKDFRRAIDDKEIDALVLGTPDHWHAIPTILACMAGKDVYTEKPDGHNAIEGRTMVAAAKKHGRIVQLGTQSRSRPHFLKAMEFIRTGQLGRVVLAKAWESARQGSIPRTPDSDPPKTVDYDLWLGPAPMRPFNRMRFHGNWRWFFDYGTGDLGNDGVHRLDYARWGLESAIAAKGEKPLGKPESISAGGGKLYFDDAQEWPDTMMVTYNYPGRMLVYEMRIWTPTRIDGEAEGAAIIGDQGSMVLGNGGWRAMRPDGEIIAQDKGGGSDRPHVQNFLDCMRSRTKPAADLETIGHPSSMLCHLGNAAWRAGRTLRFDYENYRVVGDDAANQFLTRPEYRKPWLLPRIEDV